MSRKRFPLKAASALMCLMIAAAACQTDPGEDEADGLNRNAIDSLPEFVSEGIAAQIERELARGDIAGQEREKIKHSVFLVKENRTFDHMFGRFPGAEGATEGLTRRELDGAVDESGRHDGVG